MLQIQYDVVLLAPPSAKDSTMPQFQVKKSIEIDAPTSEVFAAVADFTTWSTWSPWLCIEPEANVTVTSPANEVGSSFQWEGQLVGVGNMSFRSLQPDQSIECDLAFKKPFRSRADVRFDFEDLGDRTKVSWTLNSKLPFFMFWMTARMVAYIGMDYERGLSMLKDWIENGKIHSNIDFKGLENRPEIRLMGLRSHCAMESIETDMQRILQKVEHAFNKTGVPPNGETISIYLPSSDMQNGQVDYVSGVASPETIDSLEETILPAGRYMHVRHVGQYKHLGNAWYSVYQNAMHQKRKIGKTASYEIYGNDPKITDPKDLITDIYLPVR